MELGEKLRLARQEAGLSQRQLCGEEITRNMLSQIEHGTAKPSMTTLTYLARQLGKPVSFFLEEEAAVSPNRTCMCAAWKAWEDGDPVSARQQLDAFLEPDAIYDREYKLLRCMVTLQLAQHAIDQGRVPYARQLLQRAEVQEQQVPWLPELAYRRAQLLNRLPGRVPDDLQIDGDGILRFLARLALQQGDGGKAARLLDASDDRESPSWNLLRGNAALLRKDYPTAARCLQAAESTYPEQTISSLEQCFREMGDYRMAYHYACLSREKR